jgi:acetyl esterase/lipase
MAKPPIGKRARGYDGDRIVLMGESLGTGVAITLAATREATALVLDSPYSSAVEVAAAHYAIFPVNWSIGFARTSRSATCIFRSSSCTEMKTTSFR